MKVFYNKLGFSTLLYREIHRFFKVFVQTILAPLLSNILYLAVFGGVLKTREVGMEGVNYLQFLVPGLTTMGALMAAFQNPSFSLISQKFQGTIQDINSYPISDVEKSLAYILGGTFRGLLVGILTYVATIPFVGLRINNMIMFIVSIILTSFIFSSLGLICGLVLDNFEKMNFILAIVITPLSYLGGVFFEVSKLPGILSNIGIINPIYPLVNITRYSYLGFTEGNIYFHGISSLLFLGTAFIISIILFKKGIGIKTR